MPGILSEDESLRTVVTKLDNADDFVSRAYGVLHHACKEHGDVVLRLGITGTGRFPNYRLEDAKTGRPIEAIDGNTHAPWPSGYDFGAPGNWSDVAMSESEVEQLLGEIRNFVRKRQVRD